MVLAHTGQNYDYKLNWVFFKYLKLGDLEVYMDAVGDDLGATVGNIINCSYKLMLDIKADPSLSLKYKIFAYSATPLYSLMKALIVPWHRPLPAHR